ncbi:MAG TPA: hypothetical protein ENN80_10025, partial [Candidatus Hydrogenedentes bacterium]|nr:hypothetical protein [Candidatus Hydrogenedentota bacterium]
MKRNTCLERAVQAIGLLLLVAAIQASAQVSVSGSVLNGIKGPGREYGVEGVQVVAAMATKQLAFTMTDANGDYTFEELPAQSAPFDITFYKLEYFPGTLNGVAANSSGNNISLNPLGVTTAAKPLARSGPKSIRVEWSANPEYNVKGYNIYRTEYASDGEGNLIPTQIVANQVKLNGGADVWDEANYIDALEYTDETVQIDGWYVYQIQAISGADRPSALSIPSNPPERGQWLTLFYPVVAIETPGTYLWDQVPGEQDLLQVILPLSTRCAYDVGTVAMGLVSRLPADLIDRIIDVRPSGISVGMQSEALNVLTHADNPSVPEGQIEVGMSVADPGPARSLYGAGVLYNIVAQAKIGVDDCGDLSILRDQSRLYEEDAVTRIAFRTEKGQLCADTDCIHGDVDMNGTVNQADAQWINDYWVKNVSANDCTAYSGDINLDGEVDAADATLILRWVSGLDITPPASATNADLSAVSFAAADALKSDNEVLVGLNRQTLSGDAGDEVIV